MSASLAKVVIQRIDALARISDETNVLTRTFASPAMKRANALVGAWMRAAGLTIRIDVVGNLIGHYPGETARAKILLLGSHLDTVRNAGKFDGPLGVLLAIACVEELHRRKIRLPFALEVVAFADEEGVRFQTAYLGSRALTGTLTAADLNRRDHDGISMRQAILNFGGNPARLKTAQLDPRNVIGYLEAHIEQGPVLEEKNLPVGVVTAIAGQSRLLVEFHGVAGHAGTVPVNLRHDALAGAAEFVLAVERCGVTATVGKLEVEPGASNVIPGKVFLTLDVRDQKDEPRLAAVRSLRATANAVGQRRGLNIVWTLVQETDAVQCDKKFRQILSKCVARRGLEVLELPSGAGHDAAALSAICPVAMLFVRCKGGISHHPSESVKTADVACAIGVLADFIQSVATLCERR